MFEMFQNLLGNMLAHAGDRMALSKKMKASIQAVIDVLTDRRYVHLGFGEDVGSTTGPIDMEADRLSVDALETTPGRIIFPKITYAYDLLHLKVILEGEGLSYELVKTYSDNTTRTFLPGQMPIATNNFILHVIVQPGGHFKSATLLQRIVMDKEF